jgi:hypothetical protein
MKHIECRLHVANCRLSAMGIGRQEQVYGGEIRPSSCFKPSNAANKIFDKPEFVGVVRVNRQRLLKVQLRVHWNTTRPVRGCEWVFIACLTKEAFDKVGSKAQLIHVERNSG